MVGGVGGRAKLLTSGGNCHIDSLVLRIACSLVASGGKCRFWLKHRCVK